MHEIRNGRNELPRGKHRGIKSEDNTTQPNRCRHRSVDPRGIQTGAAIMIAAIYPVIIAAALMALFGLGTMKTMAAGLFGAAPAYADAAQDSTASARAFLAAYPVFLNPRCVNCHPAGNAPLQGDDGRPHAMNVKRGAAGMGKNAMQCTNCHQAANPAGAHMPPGGPGWQLPPEDEPMIFEKRSPHDLCVQLKDPAKNGNRTPMQVVEHVRTAPLVLWGWSPGEGRKVVPLPHDAFVKYMTEWAQKGAACPD